METHKASTPDCRTSIGKKEYDNIYRRVRKGESVDAVAADYKVTPRRIRQVTDIVRARKQPTLKPSKVGEVTILKVKREPPQNTLAEVQFLLDKPLPL